MQTLCDRITSFKCPKHGQAYCFIYKGNVKSNESRMMCDQCINTKNYNSTINIKNLFQYLDSEQNIYVDKTELCKSRMWQEFKRSQVQLIEFLKYQEKQIEEFIKSISGNQIIQTLRNEFCDRELSFQNLESIGQLVAKWIIQDVDGQYYFPQGQVPISKQFGYLQFIKMLEAQSQANDVLKTYEGQLQSALQEQQDLLKQTEMKQVVEKQDSIYETTQTLKLNDPCWFICLNTDETQLVAAVDKSLNIFNLSKQGEWIQDKQSLVCHTEWITQVKFNHDSTKIASCGYDKSIIIWSKQSNGKWSNLLKFNDHKDVVFSICFNSSSTTLASGSKDKTIQIHVLSTGQWKLAQKLTQHTNYVLDVCFNNDSSLLASGGQDHLIYIWQQNNQNEWIVMSKLMGHTSIVKSVSFSFDSTYLVSASQDKSIKIWLVDYQETGSCDNSLKEHSGTVFRSYFDQQSNMIISSSIDKSLKLWRMDKGGDWVCTQTIKQHTDYVHCSIINRDCTMIISCSHDKTIKIHKLKDQ